LFSTQSFADNRGKTYRVFDRQHLELLESDSTYVLCAENEKKGTLRGMHLQTNGFQESKLVRVLSGEIFDLIIDMRPASPWFQSYRQCILSAENGRVLFVPRGFAHGYQTLSNDTTVIYGIDREPMTHLAENFNFRSFDLGKVWPTEVSEISMSDASSRLLTLAHPLKRQLIEPLKPELI
jgi:dTDP-4-dehydrorhamnose 3,5-epimerase